MAQKRMFDKSIVESDAFLDMPLSTQALYFHLNMAADDDGFVNGYKRIARSIGASEDDLTLLNVKKFIINFETGVIVIKHWKINNTLKSDRYKPTLYQEELSALSVKGNNAYTLETQGNLQLDPFWNHSGSILEPQSSIDKNSIVKDSTDKNRLVKSIREKLTDQEIKELSNQLINKRYSLSMIIDFIDKRVEPNEIKHPYEYILKVINEWGD